MRAAGNASFGDKEMNALESAVNLRVKDTPVIVEDQQWNLILNGHSAVFTAVTSSDFTRQGELIYLNEELI